MEKHTSNDCKLELSKKKINLANFCIGVIGMPSIAGSWQTHTVLFQTTQLMGLLHYHSPCMVTTVNQF